MPVSPAFSSRLPKMFLMAVCAASLSFSALAQPGGDRGDRRGGERGDRRGGWNMEDMDPAQREQMMERMRERMAEQSKRNLERQQENLDLSDDEFAIVGPMIERVQQLVTEQAAGSGGGRGGMMRFMGDMSDMASAEGKKVIDSTAKLRELLEDDNVGSGDLKAALGSLRSARSAHAAALKTAREELRSVLSSKQEAQMVLSGMLD